MYDAKPFSQANQRSYRVFRDQHGRQWGADIENKTQAPCGPLSPRFKAPLMPPQKYLDLKNAAAGEIVVDYDRWLEDEATARAEWQTRLEQQAYHLYKDKAAEAIADPPPELLSRVGPPPEPRERILAARAEDPWVLGQSDQRPKWADRFFPQPRRADELDFMRDDTSFMEDEDAPEYPVAEGRGKYRLSDGTLFEGKKADAVQAEEALSLASAGAGADPSWAEG